MKRIVTVAAVVMGLGFTQVNAQSFVKTIISNLSGGVKTEVNASNFVLSDMPGTKSKMDIGGSAGGFVKLDMAKHFAIQEDVLVHYKRSALEQSGIKSDFQYWGLGINIYATGQWKLSTGERFYFGVGPCTEYGINAYYKTEGEKNDVYKKDATTGKTPMTQLNINAGAILGYEFTCGFQVNAGCQVGLTDALNAEKNNASMYPYSLSLGIGYRF
jgi:hypothetical protein